MRIIFIVIIAIAAILACVTFLKRSKSELKSSTKIPDTDSSLNKFLTPYTEHLEQTVRPVVWIELEVMNEDSLTVSKVGGQPYWPKGQPFPTSEQGNNLFLLAQINFEELPNKIPGYPEQGLLQFFIADTDFYGANFDGEFDVENFIPQRNFRVVFWRDTLAPTQDFPLITSDKLPHNPKSPSKMKFTIDEELISISDYRFEKIFGGNEYKAIEAFAKKNQINEDSLYDALGDEYAGNGHKIGGYPYFTQSDPRREGDWELLFQLDSDDDSNLMWGDSGVANFFISPKDLANLDFSKVIYTWDCT